MSGETVGQALDLGLNGVSGPRSITVDHGTEFQARALEDWAYRRGVQLDCIRPGKPVENAFISSLGHLTPNEFVTQRQVQQTTEAVVCSG